MPLNPPKSPLPDNKSAERQTKVVATETRRPVGNKPDFFFFLSSALQFFCTDVRAIPSQGWLPGSMETRGHEVHCALESENNKYDTR